MPAGNSIEPKNKNSFSIKKKNLIKIIFNVVYYYVSIAKSTIPTHY